MRSVILTILIVAFLPGFGQDTTYVDDDFREVKSFDECQYYAVTTWINKDSNRAMSKTYFRSGKIKSQQEVYYKDKVGRFIGGPILEWFEDGTLRRKYSYNGAINLDGEVETFYKNGKPRRKDNYKDGKLIEGHEYSEEGIEVPYTSFIQNAQFPGGNDMMVAFLLKNLKYPKSAIKKEISGIVQVKFMIDKKGNITDPVVVKSIDEDLDKEALRIVKKMPRWSPLIMDGELYSSYFLLPVSFDL